jgi:CBS domain-containing protein
MIVQKIMTEPVARCRPEDTLESAALQMWQHDCGSLPVCDPEQSERVIGMVTDRDICMNACFEHRPLGELKVMGAMSRDVKCCGPDDSIQTAERIMQEASVRRLPVVDGDGRLLGIVALADIAREAKREDKMRQPEVTEAEVALALAAISAPRRAARTAA